MFTGSERSMLGAIGGGAVGRVDALVIAAYLGLMAFIGLMAWRRRGDARAYFQARREMPAWAVALSVVATSLSVTTFIGAPAESYGGDLTYLSQNIGVFVAVIFVAIWFVPRLYAAGTITIYGFIEKRYGPEARTALAVTFLVGRLLASGVRLFIAALPLSLVLFGVATDRAMEVRHWALAIVIIGTVGTAYTVFGGIRAVIWTDAVQITIVVGAVVLSIIFLLHMIPADLGTIHRVLSSPGAGMSSKLKLIDLSWSGSARFTLWTALIGAASLNAAVYGCDQDLAQRVLTTRSAWRGGAALIGAQCLATVLGALFMVAGLLLYVFYCRPDVMGAAAPVERPAGEDVYAHFLLHYLPTGLRGLAIAGILATAQGSLDSAINAMASSVVADLYWPLRRRLGLSVDESAGAKSPWVAVLAAGAALIGVAIVAAWSFEPGRSLIAFALGIMSYAYGGMFGVFLAAIFTRRGNAASVIAALVVGAVVTVILQKGICLWWTVAIFGRAGYLSDMWWLPISASFSFAVCLIGGGRIRAAGGDPIWAGVFL